MKDFKRQANQIAHQQKEKINRDKEIQQSEKSKRTNKRAVNEREKLKKVSTQDH